MSNRKIENRMFKMVAPEIWEGGVDEVALN